jgi:CDP-6-deoxy-D-xylo-4-hexulose-3-dehydrase
MLRTDWSQQVVVRIPLNPSTFGQEDKSAAKAVVDSGELLMGQRCAEFEKAFAAYIGCDHAVMVNSGSSANLVAMFALASSPLREDGNISRIVPFALASSPLRKNANIPRIVPGAEVIVPALSWPTTVWPVVQIGAKPVFVDSDPATLQTTATMIEAAITAQTVGIIVVHASGSATNMDDVTQVARRHHLWLFEDSCEALGVLWDGKKTGSFGVMGSFSLSSSQISTIEGGMVVTNENPMADQLRALRTHERISHMDSQTRGGRADGEVGFPLGGTGGFNLRPTEINGILGLEQLKRLSRFNEKRRKVARHFDDALEPLQTAGRLRLVQHNPRCIPAPLSYAVLCKSRRDRDGLRDHLHTAGIETRPALGGNIVRHPAFTAVDYRVSGELHGANRIMDCSLCWGAYPEMTEDETDYVVSAVRRYFGTQHA